jgi:hypothetical protein
LHAGRTLALAIREDPSRSARLPLPAARRPEHDTGQAADDREQLEGCGLNGGPLTAAQGRTAEEEASHLLCA